MWEHQFLSISKTPQHKKYSTVCLF